MPSYDFRILLESVSGKKTSYYSSSFANTDVDLVLSSSQVFDRIKNSYSCSFVNDDDFIGDVNQQITFANNPLLSASLQGSLSTGSIDFTAITTEYDRLLRYKFIGDKVCTVLGLPSNQWVYVDQIRLPADDESNIIQGNMNIGNAFVSDTITFANNANVNSDIPFYIDTGSDRYIKFIDTRDTGKVSLIFGYDKDTDTYEINASTGSIFNIKNLNNLDVDTINAAVVNQVTSSTLSSTDTSFQNLIVTGSLTITDVSPSQNPLLRIGGNISSSGTGQNLFTGDLKTLGDVIAERYIVKSNVTEITTSFSAGSTIFGDTPADDTHQFTGSVNITGSLNLSENITTDTLTVNGTASFNDHITIAENKELRFDSSDSFIKASATNPEDLEIHADDDIKLEPDDDLFLSPGEDVFFNADDIFIRDSASVEYARFDGGRKNFGIGVTVPTEKLTISGNISASGDIKAQTFTAVGDISASGTISASKLFGDGSSITNIPSTSIVGLNLTQIADGTATASISETEGFKVNVNSQITGSGGSEKYALRVSQSINAYNINAGNPTSNNWQTNLEGSFFNNFTTETDVSEILRFIAGVLSSSAPNATPNTKIYNSISEDKSNITTGTAPSGRVPQNSTESDITYLISKGFASNGGELFDGISNIRTNANYAIQYDSVSGGSTSVRSSADSQLFGLGSLDGGSAVQFKVSGSQILKKLDNNSNTITETTSSSEILTNSSFGTTDGLELAKIETAQPTVIPAAFQDGKFTNIFSTNLVGWPTHAIDDATTSVSASGFYQLTSSIGIATGSQTDFTIKEAFEEIFYSPLSNIDSNIGLNSLSILNVVSSSLTLNSSSLSGMPYIQSESTWDLQFTASGVFNPMYAVASDLVDVTIGSTSGYTISKVSGEDTLSTAGGTIQTSGLVKSSDGSATARNSGVPHETDNVHINATYKITGTGETISEGGFSDTSYTLTPTAKNRESSESNLVVKTMQLHVPGEFGQPSTSGSMAYFGGGASSTTTLIERFFNETYRRIITSPTALTNAWDSTTYLTLGNGGDLQVKPGYLVNPESTSNGVGYFYPTSGFSSSHYKWYLREVETGASSNKSTLTIDMNPNSSTNFATFDTSTAGKIAIGVIFEAQLPANSGDARTTIFDAVKGNASYGGAEDNIASSNQKNPFNANVDLQGDFSSLSNSSGTLTLGLANAVGQTINGTHSKIWLLIRYTGAPSNTLERITVSTS